MTHSTPGDFNQARVLGRVHSVNRFVTGKLIGCLVSINTGEPTMIAILPGRAGLPAGLREGDRVDVKGPLGSESLSRRETLMFLKADVFEVIATGKGKPSCD